MDSVQNWLPTWIAPLLVLGSAGWILFRAVRRSHEPARLVLRWFVTACLVAGMLLFLVHGVGFGDANSMVTGFLKALIIASTAAICGILIGILWAPSIGAWAARPIASLLDGGTAEIEPAPLYSIAESRRKRGHIKEAIQEIHRQLDQFPGDLTGTLLLASIQADDLKDPETAIQTLESWIATFGDSSAKLPNALHQIANIHLSIRGDPDRAKDALARIVRRFPATEAAHLASQRIAHLSSAEMLAEKKQPHRIRIPPGSAAGTRPAPKASADASTPTANSVPEASISDCLEHLNRFPEDDEARERLAQLYAQQDCHMARARPELERLVTQPGVSRRQIVRWLNLQADLELHIAHDEPAGRATLQRIIDLFPQSAAAQNARTRLAHLKLELRRDQAPDTVRMTRT